MQPINWIKTGWGLGPSWLRRWVCASGWWDCSLKHTVGFLFEDDFIIQFYFLVPLRLLHCPIMCSIQLCWCLSYKKKLCWCLATCSCFSIINKFSYLSRKKYRCFILIVLGLNFSFQNKKSWKLWSIKWKTSSAMPKNHLGSWRP